MFSLLRKEISSFFGSLTGYVVVFVFLLATSLFLWVFPGNYNIPEGGYATLEGLFSLAPWVYLFLIPAITMRMFSEEKRMGTMELLLTRPITLKGIVLAKFLAGLFLVFISLLPTFIYFFSVYSLGNPAGNLDMGGTWGSYIGLFFLASAYLALGLLSSSLTDNPVFAFLLALFLSFIAYIGFEFAGSLQFSSDLQQILMNCGINEHYLSLSRGVIDSRDIFYFLALVFIVLFITVRILQFDKTSLRNVLKSGVTILFSVTLLGIFSSNYFFRIDLTAEKRYLITKVSKTIVGKLDKPVSVTLYLDGELPAGFRKLQKSIIEKIDDYNAFSAQHIHLTVVDPYQIADGKRREELFAQLAGKGLQPTDIRQNSEQGTMTRRIFPGALIEYGNKQISVNLLKNNTLLHAEQNLNNSIESLEYEISSAFSNLMTDKKQTVAFLTGQGELNEYELNDFIQSLKEKYQVRNCISADLLSDSKEIKTLIVANPTQAFTEHEKFAIDQYLMKGGRILWLIDPVSVSLDSLSSGHTTLAFPRKLNLDDQLFRYGIRINPDLIQDVECILIPVNTAPAGTPVKWTPAPWYYSPLLKPSENHVVSRNLNRIKAEFVSSIDTVGNSGQLIKKVILSTSDYSLVTRTPVEINLAIINNPPSRQLFNQPSIPAGVLIEGTFNSVFKNRILEGFGVQASEVIAESRPTKMIVFSDGNLAANKYRFSGGKPEFMALGYDQYSKQTFGNKDLLLNAVNYLCDDDGLMELRSRVIQIRLLDKVKLKEDQLFWQTLNVLLPVVLIAVFGFIFILIRKLKYSKL